jgi:hypothetical protein
MTRLLLSKPKALPLDRRRQARTSRPRVPNFSTYLARRRDTPQKMSGARQQKLDGVLRSTPLRIVKMSRFRSQYEEN